MERALFSKKKLIQLDSEVSTFSYFFSHLQWTYLGGGSSWGGHFGIDTSSDGYDEHHSGQCFNRWISAEGLKEYWRPLILS